VAEELKNPVNQRKKEKRDREREREELKNE